MGFDNECIQNIQSLAGEYFCPVCRLLVYPDEALYTQCTHLYCKPCLAYVVSTTRTCPYDGYPVSEADTKPVTEANKALAETIGRIAVNCLYHRSGCAWQGTLSETTAHCAGCAFGNSPVVCNRCGTQIVHRQVQEHAQICPGEQPLAQQAENPTVAVEQNQAATQAGVPASQPQPAEAAAAPGAGQGQNQGTSNAQPQATPQVAPTPEQWYQQQQQYYQQYYQQYPGYDPYQQQYQQYVQYQQQFAAHPQQVILGQPQPQPFIQPQSQPQPQTQPQAPSQGQPQPQPHSQPQPQPQPQSQPQAQPHPPFQPQVASQPQIQAQVPQQQPHAPVQPHPQMQPQSHVPPLAQQQVGHPHLQPHPQQHPQMTQHPQPHPQMQHPQPHPHPQSHPRPQQPQPQPQAYPQPHLQHPSQLQPQPQPQHPAAHAVTGHQSYPQPQPYQQMPPGAPQHSAHIHPQQQAAPHQMLQQPVQMQAQFPSQQPSQMRPPHNPVPQQLPQQPVMTPMQGQPAHVPPVQQQQLAYHPGQQIHHQAMQLPQQQHLPHQQPHFPQQQGHAPVQQPQPFPGQAPGTVHNQQHQQSPFAPPQPIQPLQSLRPQGLPLHQPAHSQPQLQQNFPLAQGLATHHSQNPAGRTMVPNQALMHQPPNQTPVGLAGSILGQDVHSVTKVIQPGVGQPSPNQGILSWTNNHPLLASDQQPGPLQQSLLPRSDIQSTLLSVSSHSRKNAQVSAAQATLKPIFSEKSQGDSMPGKAGEVPKLDADGTNVSVSRVAELKAPISENDLKSSEGEEKMVDGSDDKGRPDRAVNEIDSSMKHEKDLKSSENDGDSEEPVIKQMVKEETSEKFESTEAGNDEKEDEASQHTVKEVQDGPAHRSLSSLAAENLEGKDVTLRQDPVDSHILRPWSDGSGSLNSHSGTDKGPRGQALGAVPERSMHALLRPPIVGPGYERPLPHPGYHDKNLPQFPHQGSVPDEHRGLLSPGQMPGKNFVHPSHFAPVPDQDRYHLPAPYGPSPLMQDRVSQRPPGTGGMFPPSMSLPGTSHERNFQEPVALQMQMHGPPMAHMRPQGRNALEGFPEHQQGQPSIAQEHFQTPMTKQPHGSFPSEIPPGGFPGRGMPPLFGREPSLLGPPQGFELQSSGPHGHRQGLMRPPYAGSQRTSQGKGAVGGMQDTSFLHGLPEERFKPFPEERYKPGLEEGFKPPADERFQPFPLDSGRRVVDRREFEEDLKQFPRPANLDGENMSRPLDRGPHTFGERPSHVLSRDIGLKSDGGAGVPSGSAFPVGSGGPLHLVEAGDRLRPGSLPDNLGRNTDPSGAPPDFLRHVSEFGRHPARSPGREHPGLPSSRFGNSPAGLGLGSQPRLEDLDGRDLHGFGERWLRRAELDGPGSLRMNEQLGSGRSLHLRSGDMVGPDLLPIHLRGGEPIGHGSLLNHVRSGEPRNLPGHLHLGDPLGPGQLRIGEPTTFGGIPSHLRMGGPGHLPSHLRIGESVGGGNFPSHLRIAEPGFGSGFPMQGFQGGPQGDMESFDHSRKRKPGSTGWCRICKIDCESVEGLELHSQTREHQKMAMEMVLSIKQDNAKKQTLSSEEHVSREDANKKRKTNFETRGTRK